MWEGFAIGTGLGLLSNLFDDDSEREKALHDLINRIRNLQGFSQSDIEKNVADVYRGGQTSMMNSANSLALSAAGRQNYFTSAVTKLLPTINTLGQNISYNMQLYNKQLELQKLQAEGGLTGMLDDTTAQDDIFSALGLGLQGAMLQNTLGQTQQLKNINSIYSKLFNANRLEDLPLPMRYFNLGLPY